MTRHVPPPGQTRVSEAAARARRARRFASPASPSRAVPPDYNAAMNEGMYRALRSDAEKRGDGNAARWARTQEQYWKHRKETAQLMEHGKEIRAWRDAQLRLVVEALVRVGADTTLSDRERAQKRRLLEERYRAIDDEAQRRMRQWVALQQAEAARLAASEPALDAAGEARALRHEMRVDALVRQFAESDPRRVRDDVLGEAQRYLAINAFDMAHVWANAARRLGVTDESVDRAIDGHLDATLPHRKQAKELRESAAAEHNTLALAVLDDLISFRIGRPEDVARAFSRAELMRAGMRDGQTTATIDGREKNATPAPFDVRERDEINPRDLNAPLPA